MNRATKYYTQYYVNTRYLTPYCIYPTKALSPDKLLGSHRFGVITLCCWVYASSNSSLPLQIPSHLLSKRSYI